MLAEDGKRTLIQFNGFVRRTQCETRFAAVVQVGGFGVAIFQPESRRQGRLMPTCLVAGMLTNSEQRCAGERVFTAKPRRCRIIISAAFRKGLPRPNVRPFKLEQFQPFPEKLVALRVQLVSLPQDRQIMLRVAKPCHLEFRHRG